MYIDEKIYLRQQHERARNRLNNEEIEGDLNVRIVIFQLSKKEELLGQNVPSPLQRRNGKRSYKPGRDEPRILSTRLPSACKWCDMANT
jgi:hypothetical protein